MLVGVARHEFEAQLPGNDLGIACREHRRNPARREKLQKTYIAGALGCRFNLRALCTIAYEHEAHALVCKMASRCDQRVPGAVETKIAGVHKNERKIP